MVGMARSRANPNCHDHIQPRTIMTRVVVMPFTSGAVKCPKHSPSVMSPRVNRRERRAGKLGRNHPSGRLAT